MAQDQPNKEAPVSKDQPGKEVPASDKPESQAEITKFANDLLAEENKSAGGKKEEEISEEEIIEEEAGDTKETAGKEDKGSKAQPKIKVGDQEFTAEEILEMQKSHKNKEDWQKELTKKSQETAEEKKQLAAMAEQFKAYGTLDEYLAAHPEKAKAIAEMLSEGDEPIVEISDDDPVEGQKKLAQAIKQQRKDLETKIEDLQLVLATKDKEIELERSISAARSKHPNMGTEDELEILGKIEAGNEKSFEVLADEWAGREKVLRDKHINEFIKEKRASKAVAGKGGGGSPPPVTDKVPELGSSEHLKETTAFLESLNKEGG